MNDYERKQIDKLLNKIKKLEQTFGKAMLGLALSKDEQNEFKVSYGNPVISSKRHATGSR